METLGSGKGTKEDLYHWGITVNGSVIEDGVRIFYPLSFKFGDNVYVGHDTILQGAPNVPVQVGSNSWIGPQCHFQCEGGLSIGRDVYIGSGVKILTFSHDVTKKQVLNELPLYAVVNIREDVYIDIGAVIMAGITIGVGAVVAPGAVVFEDVKPYTVVAGNPAEPIGRREV